MLSDGFPHMTASLYERKIPCFSSIYQHYPGAIHSLRDALQIKHPSGMIIKTQIPKQYFYNHIAALAEIFLWQNIYREGKLCFYYTIVLIA
jgi:hypothetical protein